MLGEDIPDVRFTSTCCSMGLIEVGMSALADRAFWGQRLHHLKAVQGAASGVLPAALP